jgi:hypothetical protein
MDWIEKGVTPVADLTSLLETFQLQIECRHCGCCEDKTLNWLNERRDMNCCQCGGVIVLNTSERKREIAALRRQVASLHDQLVGTIIPGADCVLAKVSGLMRSALTAPQLELSLVDAYRDCSGRNLNGQNRAAARCRR